MATGKKTVGNARTKAAAKPSRAAKPKKPPSKGPPKLVELEGTLVSLYGPSRNSHNRAQDATHQAQQLIYQAFEVREPRRRVELANQALEIWRNFSKKGKTLTSFIVSDG